MKNKLFILALLLVSAQMAVYGMQGLKRSSRQGLKFVKQPHMLQSREFFKQPNMQLQKEPVQDFKPVPVENKLVPVKNKLVGVDTKQLRNMKIKEDKDYSYNDKYYDDAYNNSNNKGYRSYAKVGAAGGGLFAGLVAWWNGLFSSDIDDVLAILPDGTDGFQGLAGDRKRNLEQIRKIVSSGKKHVYDSLDGEGQVIIYEGKAFQGRSKEEELFGLYRSDDYAHPFVAIYKKNGKTIAKMVLVASKFTDVERIAFKSDVSAGKTLRARIVASSLEDRYKGYWDQRIGVHRIYKTFVTCFDVLDGREIFKNSSKISYVNLRTVKPCEDFDEEFWSGLRRFHFPVDNDKK